MLAVQVELLTGRYVASRFNDRTRAEWPPHPSRLFSAAVAAWAERDCDPAEQAALEWWEGQGAPQIACSWGEDGPPARQERAPVTHYVPDNDPQAVARDPSVTYEQLVELLARSASGADLDAKTAGRLERDLAKAKRKAVEVSEKVTTGSAPASALEVLPDHRGRKARWYPTIVPESDRITYVWPEAAPDPEVIAALDRVLARIGRLGHSSSFASITLVADPEPPVLVPDELGDLPLRVPSPGQLSALRRAFTAHQGIEPRVLPSVIEAYGRARIGAPPAPASVMANRWTLLDLSSDHRRFRLREGPAVARAVRQSLMAHSPQQPPPSLLSGHSPGAPGESTGPLSFPHLAVVPLPFVGGQHADGRIMGIALIPPREVDDEDDVALRAAVERWLEAGGVLRLGRFGAVSLARLDVADAPTSAKPARWCRRATTWITATPIALDRHPGNLSDRRPDRRRAAEQRAIESITRSCRHIGLPEPTQVEIAPGPLLQGSAPANAFPPYEASRGKVRRFLTHALVRFDEVVEGPLLLGAGRYLGLGLCAPLIEERSR